MLQDAELLRLYTEEHSEDAFAQLVQRYVDLVYSAALRQVGGDAYRAQDVVQVVFTTLARKAGLLVHHPVLAGWLYTATQHAATKTIRSEIRRHAREQEAHAMQIIQHPSDDSAAIDWERVRPVLDDAMRELSDRDREAVLLRFFARRPFAEIGAALNLSGDAARMRVERALDKLHALLARRGVTSTSAALAVALSAQAVVASPPGFATVVTGVALAGATAGAGVAGGARMVASALTFMSTGKIAGVIVALGGLAAGGFGVYGLKQMRGAEASLASISAERDALHGRLRDTEARVVGAETRARESEARIAALQKAAESSRGSRMTPPTVAGVSVSDELVSAPLKAKLVEAAVEKQAVNQLRTTNADFQRAIIEGQKSGLGVRFGPLYKNLNLSPEQVAKFEQRLADSFQDEVDFAAAIHAKGFAPNDPAIATLATTEKARLETDLRAILGEAGLRDYQNYERSYGAREMVNTLLGNLVYNGSLLSPQQVNQLTQVLAEQSPAYQKGGRVPGRAQDVKWDSVVDQATQFLLPPQLDALRAVAEQARAIRRVQEFTEPMIRKVSPSAANPTAGAPKPPGS
jgi:RNA polymerase sigma factor (sigma-70 family)